MRYAQPTDDDRRDELADNLAALAEVLRSSDDVRFAIVVQADLSGYVANLLDQPGTAAAVIDAPRLTVAA